MRNPWNVTQRYRRPERPPVEKGEEGWITNLQDFVVHDGPGLRMLIFLKGCPLHCRWCQNPENLDLLPQIGFRKSNCVGCRRCTEACPVEGAILDDDLQRIDRSKCTRCMACVDTCLGKALQKAGERVSIEEVVRKVMPYKPFFDHSDRGGVTLSGGDPIFQPEFTRGLLEAFHDVGIHTTVETCGYVDYPTLRRIVQHVDVLIYDLKHMDEQKHMVGTGRPNRPILDNLQRLCEELQKEIVVHVPLICRFNDDDRNIRSTAEFVRALKTISHIDLLPFNEMASEKYRAFGLDWEYFEVRRQSEERLSRLKDIVESCGLEVTIGGLW